MVEQPASALHVITDLEPGGAETMLSRLVAHPAGEGLVRHRVVSLLGEGSLGPALRAAGVSVDDLGLRSARDFPAAIWRLARLIRRERPDAVMTWLYHADLVGTLASRVVPGTSLIWNIRCADMDLSRYGRTTQALPKVLALLSRLPAAVVANSEAGKRVHSAYGYRPRRWAVLPNGFDCERFKPDPAARSRIRRELGIAARAPVTGLVARFDPMKDHETFFAAAAVMAERLPEARFLAVGRGVDSPACAALAARHAGLGGRLVRLGERSDVAQVMAAIDLCASSSITEGFSNVIGEAMACGVPCVVTDVGDSAALVADTGRVVPPRDPRALAEAALDLLGRSPAERESRAAAARERIIQNYSLDAVVRRYAELLGATAGRH